jgi:hypothetical protein
VSINGRVLAPVVVFSYMRVDHLRRSIESLLANPEAASTDVVFFCDAAKRPEHQPQVEAVRAYVDSISGFRTITRIYREANMGLARSVMEGVTQALGSHGRVIVMEDDLVLSPHFLRFMNDGLERYEHDDRVASIHGYIYPVDGSLPETFFLKGADCWGWATWSRAWASFERDGSRLLAELHTRRLNRDFDFDWQYPYTSMLEDQIRGRNSSWAILWHASCYLKGLLTLYPGRTLVKNIGNDSSGTHCGTTNALSGEPSPSQVRVDPIPVEPSYAARAAFVRFFSAQRTWNVRVRALTKRLLRAQA